MNCWHACLLLALVLPARPGAEPAVEISLDVTALRSELSGEMRALMREAAALWQPAGVRLTWIQSAASRALPRSAIVLSVVTDENAPPSPMGRGLVRLGFTAFRDGDGAAEPTLRLSVKSVSKLVDETKWAGRYAADWPPAIREELLGRALGRVLAHEIGHFLFAWRRHSPAGLMRAEFGAIQLLESDRRPFMLPASLMPRLQAHLNQLTGRVRTLMAVE